MAKNTEVPAEVVEEAAPEIKPTEEPTEFPVGIEEFLTGNRLVETSYAFGMLMKAEGIGGNRMRSEWQELLDLFRSKPTGTTWTEWTTINRGGKN